MKRLYFPYWVWEDYKAGLYNLTTEYTEIEIEELANMAKDILSNSEVFLSVALKVISEWKHAAKVNLTNPSRNRQAWIGQASCCYVLNIPEYITKFGWRLMTIDQQAEANRVADMAIKDWEDNYAKKILGQKCL